MEKCINEAVPYILDVWKGFAAERPEARVIFDDEHPDGMTRSELDDISSRISAWLAVNGIGREDFVFIHMPRGIRTAASMIGVWKAGAAFVVCEADAPSERSAFIKNDCGCGIEINEDLWEEIISHEPSAGYIRADDHDAAFAVYTSGSTGTPKGVLHEYGSLKLIHLTNIERQGIDGNADARTALTAPLSFVASVKILVSFMYGGYGLDIVSYDVAKDPRRLNEYCRAHDVRLAFFTPSAFRSLGDELSPSFRYITLGGEAVNGIYRGGAVLETNYSMSESAFTLCRFTIDKEYSACPLGKPVWDGIVIKILDKNGSEVPDGETGEICFEAPYFRGYINDPDETSRVMRGGLFHSSDLAFVNDEGDYVFAGRADEMIKIGGNRIEPGEVEAAFNRISGTNGSAVRGFDRGGRQYLCMYYTEEPQSSIDEIKTMMADELPRYMLPAFFIHLDSMPMLENGKTDKRSLPEPDSGTLRPPYEAPRSETEERLCRAFETAFGMDRAGINEDFEQLGGDSLAAMSVIAASGLEDLNVMQIYEGRTPAKIAELYSQAADHDSWSDILENEMRERSVPHKIPAQVLRMFLTQGVENMSTPELFRFDPSVGAEKLRKAVCEAFRNRPALFMHFEKDSKGDIWLRYDPSSDVDVEIMELSEESFEVCRNGLLKPFDLYNGPLVHAGIYKTESSLYFFVDFNHLIVDGGSSALLMEDIARAYRGEDLPTDTYCSLLGRYGSNMAGRSGEARAYLEKTYGRPEEWLTGFTPAYDYKESSYAREPNMINIDQAAYRSFLDKNRVTTNLFFCAVMALTMASVESCRKVMVSYIFNNRTDIIKKNAFGALVSTVFICIDADPGLSAGSFFREIRKRLNDMTVMTDYEDSYFLEGDTYISCPKINAVEPEANEQKGLATIGGERLHFDQIGSYSFSTVLYMIEYPESSIVMLLQNERFSKEQRLQIHNRFQKITDRLIYGADPENTKIGELLGE